MHDHSNDLYTPGDAAPQELFSIPHPDTGRPVLQLALVAGQPVLRLFDASGAVSLSFSASPGGGGISLHHPTAAGPLVSLAAEELGADVRLFDGQGREAAWLSSGPGFGALVLRDPDDRASSAALVAGQGKTVLALRIDGVPVHVGGQQ